MTLRILTAGGCHVVGYPIGEAHSFVQVMRRTLASERVLVETRSLGYLPVTHVKRLTEGVQSFHPDITVLQLGNFETTATFRQYVRRKLGLKRSKSSAQDLQLSPDSTFHGTAKWRLKCRIKLALDTLLGHDLVDMRALELSFSSMFDALVDSNPGLVLVLNSLPCADPLYMRYRQRLQPMLQRLSGERGFHFISEPLGSQRRGCCFADATHLNALGQERLGETVAAQVNQFVDHSQELTADPLSV